MVLELYDIYDAEDSELLAELQRLKRQEDGGELLDSSRKLLDHIEQELFERGVSGSLSNQLVGIADEVEATLAEQVVDESEPERFSFGFGCDASTTTTPKASPSPAGLGAEQSNAGSSSSCRGGGGSRRVLSFESAEEAASPSPMPSPSPIPSASTSSASNSEQGTPQKNSLDENSTSQSSIPESPSVQDAAMIAFREERNRLASARKFNKQKKFIQEREAILERAERKKSYAQLLAKKTEKVRLKKAKQQAARKTSTESTAKGKANPWKGGGSAKPARTSSSADGAPRKTKPAPNQREAKAASMNGNGNRKDRANGPKHLGKAKSDESRGKLGQLKNRKKQRDLANGRNHSLPADSKEESDVVSEKSLIEIEPPPREVESELSKTTSLHEDGGKSELTSPKPTAAAPPHSRGIAQTESSALEEEEERERALNGNGANDSCSESPDGLHSMEGNQAEPSETVEEVTEVPNLNERTGNKSGVEVSAPVPDASSSEADVADASHDSSVEEERDNHECRKDLTQAMEQSAAEEISIESDSSEEASPQEALGEESVTSDPVPHQSVRDDSVEEGMNGVSLNSDETSSHHEAEVLENVESEIARPCEEGLHQENVGVEESRESERLVAREDGQAVAETTVSNPTKEETCSDGTEAKREIDERHVDENEDGIETKASPPDPDEKEVEIEILPSDLERDSCCELIESKEVDQGGALEREREDEGKMDSDEDSDQYVDMDDSPPLSTSDEFDTQDDVRDEFYSDDLPLPVQFIAESDPLLHPFAGAARSLTIKELPSLETMNPLSEWIRPMSANNGVSAWGGTPSPPSSPTGFMSFESGFRRRGNNDESEVFPAAKEQRQRSETPAESPKQQHVSYAVIYESIEEIFGRFIGEEKLSLGRPFSGRKSTSKGKSKAVQQMKTTYTDRDVLAFLELYRGSLYSWLREFKRLETKSEESGEELEEDKNAEAEAVAVAEEENALPTKNLHMVYKVTDERPEVYKLVTASFQHVGNWHEDQNTDSGNPHWNIMWSWSSKPKLNRQDLNIWQRVNHYPGANQLTRKDILKKNLAYCKKVFRHNKSVYRLFDVMPLTFSLPQEYVQFCNAFSENITFEKPNPKGKSKTDQPPKIIYGSENMWIMKPVSSSRGRGIFLINSIEEVEYGEAFVIQKYVSNPLLIHRHKFDLRLYVLVTCFNPLEAWLYKEGFARFCCVPYSSEKDDMHDKYIHLTNSSVQQNLFQDSEFSLPDCLSPLISDDPLLSLPGGSKHSLKYLQTKFEDYGIKWEAIWQKIRNAVLAALFSAQGKIPFQPNSFELFGFDVMIDADLKVWLLEVNASPSLGIQTPLDQHLKKKLICDVLKLVDPTPYDRSALLEVVQKKIFEIGNPKSRPSTSNQNTSANQTSLNSDIGSILHGLRPRQYGELPDSIGDFERIAPSDAYRQFSRLKLATRK